MKAALECIACLVRQATEAVEMSGGNRTQQERLLRQLLHEIADLNWDQVPVSITQYIQRKICAQTGTPDPYQALKKHMNSAALKLLPTLSAKIRQHPNPREAILRLAIAGNLLDAGSKTRLAPEDLATRLQTIWDTPLWGSLDALFKAAQAARRILYLADNAGEIVFDRLLIEALPLEKITVAVRGSPIINDATMKDARIAGITNLVQVIANGSDAPGTLLRECSPDFQTHYRAADLIIAKGQGNYESLAGSSKQIFFLLCVKCPTIAAHIGAPPGSLVVQRGRRPKTARIASRPKTNKSHRLTKRKVPLKPGRYAQAKKLKSSLR